MELLAGTVARRTGRPDDDVGVRTVAGAAVGAAMAATFATAADPAAHFVTKLDASMAYLEQGLRL